MVLHHRLGGRQGVGEGGERYRGGKWEEEKEKVKRRGRESEKGLRGEEDTYTQVL